MMSVIVLLILAVVGLIVLGTIVATVILLANPKTRMAGIVLLLLLVIAPAIILYMLVEVRGTPDPVAARQRAVLTEMLAESVEFKRKATEVKALPLEVEDVAVETAERPDWVGAEPRRVGDAYQRTIVVGPYTTRLECDTHLPETLEEALAEYVEACLGREAVARVRLPRGELQGLLVRQQWEETKEYATVGPMKNLHVLLQFDRKLKGYIAQRWKEAIVADRLWITGGTLGAVLVLLTGLFVFLKIQSGREQRPREVDY